MNNSLKESIHLFINIIPSTSIICRTVKRRKKKSCISSHRNGNVKESKTSHLPIPQYVVTENMLPRLQASHTKQSIQRNLNFSKRKLKGLRYNNNKIQAQTKLLFLQIEASSMMPGKIKKSPIPSSKELLMKPAPIIGHQMPSSKLLRAKPFLRRGRQMQSSNKFATKPTHIMNNTPL